METEDRIKSNLAILPGQLLGEVANKLPEDVRVEKVEILVHYRRKNCSKIKTIKLGAMR
ncbi:hypothetical protein LCGC14_2021970 [marine sediment metagenome]|uniref:Uncharacterized protein n=1 Tax=marine sediment metagenome TaxID=412755 RepID=A0A0F9EXD0_9ZZZZ